MAPPRQSIRKAPQVRGRADEGSIEARGSVLFEWVKRLAGLIGLVSTVLGVVFVLAPNIKPQPAPAESSARFGSIELEQPMTFGQYLDRIRLPRKPYVDAAGVLARNGAFVSGNVTIKGYKRKSLPLRWTLIDVERHEIVDQQDEIVSLLAVREVDPSRWQVWAPLPTRDGVFRLVVEIYAPNATRGQPPLDSISSRSFENTRGARAASVALSKPQRPLNRP
jgi:hypothetical protein